MQHEEAPDTVLCTEAPDALALRFESIGHLCEFGVVQRFCGAEPLGFLRFASLPYDALIELLANRFTTLDAPDGIAVFTRPGSDEWIGRIARYGIEYHTGRSAKDISEDLFLRQERKRLALLTRKLQEQLDQPDKIVLRRDPGRPGMEAVFHALRKHGPHRLLWVDHTYEPHQIGSVETLRPDFVRAAYGYFWPNAAPSPEGLGVWVRLLNDGLFQCDRARWHQLRDAVRARAPAADRIRAAGWYAANRAHAQPATAHLPAPPSGIDGLPVVEHSLPTDMVVADGPVFCCDVTPPASEGVYVLSALIWLPAAFAGWAGMAIVGATWIQMWPASLEHRECWQRIVTSVRLAAGQPTSAGLFVQASAGTRFFSTGWTIERGCVPADCLVLPREKTVAGGT